MDIVGLEQKAKTHIVKEVWDGFYEVTSGASGASYFVNIHTKSCTCPYGQLHKVSHCSHIMAAINYQAEQRGQSATFFEAGANEQAYKLGKAEFILE